MEGWDRAKGGNIKEKNPITGRGSDNWKNKNTIALKIVTVTKSKIYIYIYIYPKTTLLGHCRERISLHKLVFSLFFFAFSPSLVHCERCLINWNLVFSPLSINSLYWTLWALIHLPFGFRIQNPPLQLDCMLLLYPSYLQNFKKIKNQLLNHQTNVKFSSFYDRKLCIKISLLIK